MEHLSGFEPDSPGWKPGASPSMLQVLILFFGASDGVRTRSSTLATWYATRNISDANWRRVDESNAAVSPAPGVQIQLPTI